MSRTVIPLNELFNAVTAGSTGVFAEAGQTLKPLSESSALRIAIGVTVGRKLSLLIKRGGTTVTVGLNDDNALINNQGATFVWSGGRGDTIDVQFEDATTVLVLRVDEVKGAVI